MSVLPTFRGHLTTPPQTHTHTHTMDSLGALRLSGVFSNSRGINAHKSFRSPPVVLFAMFAFGRLRTTVSLRLQTQPVLHEPSLLSIRLSGMCEGCFLCLARSPCTAYMSPGLPLSLCHSPAGLVFRACGETFPLVALRSRSLPRHSFLSGSLTR